MLLRNQTQSHLQQTAPSDNGGTSQAILNEIGRVLGLPAQADPSSILDTVRKLERVVKAVPRMENFIHNVSITMSEDE